MSARGKIPFFDFIFFLCYFDEIKIIPIVTVHSIKVIGTYCSPQIWNFQAEKQVKLPDSCVKSNAVIQEAAILYLFFTSKSSSCIIHEKLG